MKTVIHSARLLALLLLAFCFSAGLQYLYAWTGAADNPPDGNVAPAINVGSTNQVKDGGLGVDALAVFGQTSMLGQLDLGGSEIVNVATPTTDNSVATKGFVDQLALDVGAGAGGDSVMYLVADGTPAQCPSGWEEADYNQVIASGWDEENTFYNNIRTCYAPLGSCQVMYLSSLNQWGAYSVADCPSGWDEADTKSRHALASPSFPPLKNAVRTCYRCNE